MLLLGHVMCVFPKGRLEMSDVSPCLESRGCHLIPLYYLLSCSSAYFHCCFYLVSFFFLPTYPFSWLFFPENSPIFFLKRGFLVPACPSHWLAVSLKICVECFCVLFYICGENDFQGTCGFVTFVWKKWEMDWHLFLTLI